MNRLIAPEMAPFSNLYPRIADKLPQRLLPTRQPFSTRFLLLTLHPKADLTQVLINAPLCTSCAGATHLVEGRGKTGRRTENAMARVLGPHVRAHGQHRWQTGEAVRQPVKNGSRSANSPPPSAKSASGADFTVDIPSRGRKIQPSGFPTQRASSSRYRAGNEKNLPRRKNE